MAEKPLFPDAYGDIYSQDPQEAGRVRRIRANQARHHLSQLINLLPEGTTLEIGAGMGGVTLAHAELYPLRKIIILDRNIAARQTAQRHGSSFIQADMLELSLDEFAHLAHDADAILALRTSFPVAQRLLEFSQAGLGKSITFSVMADPDLSHFSALIQHTKSLGGNAIILTNGRIPQEIGCVVPFPLAPSSQLA